MSGDRKTHYARSAEKTICGLIRVRKNSKGKIVRLPVEKEIGCVSCSTCTKVYINAGLKALGVKRMTKAEKAALDAHRAITPRR